MSEKNGDKARYGRERRKKSLKRQIIRDWFKGSKEKKAGAAGAAAAPEK